MEARFAQIFAAACNGQPVLTVPALERLLGDRRDAEEVLAALNLSHDSAVTWEAFLAGATQVPALHTVVADWVATDPLPCVEQLLDAGDLGPGADASVHRPAPAMNTREEKISSTGCDSVCECEWLRQELAAAQRALQAQLQKYATDVDELVQAASDSEATVHALQTSQAVLRNECRDIASLRGQVSELQAALGQARSVAKDAPTVVDSAARRVNCQLREQEQVQNELRAQLMAQTLEYEALQQQILSERRSFLVELERQRVKLRSLEDTFTQLLAETERLRGSADENDGLRT